MSTTLELPIVTEVKAKASLEAYLMTAHYQKMTGYPYLIPNIKQN